MERHAVEKRTQREGLEILQTRQMSGQAPRDWRLMISVI